MIRLIFHNIDLSIIIATDQFIYFITSLLILTLAFPHLLLCLLSPLFFLLIVIIMTTEVIRCFKAVLGNVLWMVGLRNKTVHEFFRFHRLFFFLFFYFFFFVFFTLHLFFKDIDLRFRNLQCFFCLLLIKFDRCLKTKSF